MRILLAMLIHGVTPRLRVIGGRQGYVSFNARALIYSLHTSLSTFKWKVSDGSNPYTVKSS